MAVDVAGYAKQHFNKSVRKTLTIPTWLNNASLEQGIMLIELLKKKKID